MPWELSKASRQPSKVLGVLLVSLGVILTVLLAWLGSSSEPPSSSQQAVIAIGGIVAQLGGAWAFQMTGRADPTLARRAVARLFNRAQRAELARKSVERLLESDPSPSALRREMQSLSVTLGVLEEGYVESIEDWATFHEAAVQKAINPVDGTRLERSKDDE